MWDINYDTMKWLDPAGKTLRIVEICKFFKIKAAVYWFYKNKLRKYIDINIQIQKVISFVHYAYLQKICPHLL